MHMGLLAPSRERNIYWDDGASGGTVRRRIALTERCSLTVRLCFLFFIYIASTVTLSFISLPEKRSAFRHERISLIRKPVRAPQRSKSLVRESTRVPRRVNSASEKGRREGMLVVDGVGIVKTQNMMNVEYRTKLDTDVDNVDVS